MAALVHSKNGYSIGRCRQCALVQADPVPTDDELAAFYDGFMYNLPNDGDAEQFRALIEANVERMVADFRGVPGVRTGSLLDVGGGLGFYAAAFARHFTAVTMQEIDATAVDYARRRFSDSVEILSEPVESLCDSGRTFDVIFANQVIEHHPDPVRFLGCLRQLSHDGTLVVVTTPNNTSWSFAYRPDFLYLVLRRVRLDGLLGMRPVVSLVRDSWVCCDPPRHLYAFNVESIGVAARRAGLTPTSVVSVYCTQDYYSPRKYALRSLRSKRDWLQLALNLVVGVTGPAVRVLDPGARHGDDLVAYFRPAGAAP